MTEEMKNPGRRTLGRKIFIATISATLIALLLVIIDNDLHPRTDDASVRANSIEIAPEVSGRLVRVPVKDNAFVKQGDLLFEIDPRDYKYDLQQALSPIRKIWNSGSSIQNVKSRRSIVQWPQPTPQFGLPRRQYKPPLGESTWPRQRHRVPRRQ